jgi:hypothetical protein
MSAAMDAELAERAVAALWADDRFRAALLTGDMGAVVNEYQRLLDDDPDVQAVT